MVNFILVNGRIRVKVDRKKLLILTRIALTGDRPKGHVFPPPRRGGAATLSHARDIARANGVRYVYTGNVHDRAGGSTWCHGCGALLIGRDWFDHYQPRARG